MYSNLIIFLIVILCDRSQLTNSLDINGTGKCALVNAEESTIGLFRVSMGPRGLCVNREPVEGFKWCRGICDSGESYDRKSRKYMPWCTCCRVDSFVAISAPLTCEDDSVQPHDVLTPASCSCRPCLDNLWKPPGTLPTPAVPHDFY